MDLQFDFVHYYTFICETEKATAQSALNAIRALQIIDRFPILGGPKQYYWIYSSSLSLHRSPPEA